MTAARQKILVSVGIALSVLFLWLSLRDTNVWEISRVLRNADHWVAFPLLVTLFLSYWIKAKRWSVLLRPLRGVSAADVFPAVMIGYASNIALPAQLGEIVRAFVVGRRFDIRTTPALATIVLERMFDFLVVVLLLGMALLVAPQSAPEVIIAGYVSGCVGLLILAGSIAYIRWTDWFVASLGRLLVFVPDRFRAAFVNQAELGASGLSAIRDWRIISSVVGFSVVQWVFMGVCTYLSLIAVGIEAPLPAAFVVVALTVVGLTLPSSPGFFGTIQLSFVLALAPFGVSPGDAVAASVFWHFLAYASVAVVGSYFLMRMGLSPTDLHRHVRNS